MEQIQNILTLENHKSCNLYHVENKRSKFAANISQNNKMYIMDIRYYNLNNYFVDQKVIRFINTIPIYYSEGDFTQQYYTVISEKKIIV